MNTAWSFEHSVRVRATQDIAWAYWSNVANWASVDPAVEWARLDGPFAAGTRGETKPLGAPATQWTLSEVEPGTRAVIELAVPGAVLRFVWTFRDGNSGGATLTQRVELISEKAGQYSEAMQGLAQGIPAGMAKLAAAIDRFAGEPSQ